MLDTLLTLLSVVIGLYVAVRMFRRSLRPVWAAVHGYVLSSWEGVRDSTPNRDAPDTNQLEPVFIEPVRTSSERLPYHATSDDFVVWLAIIRVDGKQISANKIADMVGGTRADVLEKVRGVRPQVKPPDDAPAVRPGYEPYQDGGKPPLIKLF